jgi:hypothetical protein
MMKCLLAFLLSFLFFLTASASELEPIQIRSLDRPYDIVLGTNRVTAFVMPGAIQSTRIPPSAIKYFVAEADQGSNILYLTPRKEIQDPETGKTITTWKSLEQPVTLFIVVGGNPYEFSIKVSDGDDYRHQVLVSESPLEAAKRREVESLQGKYHKETAELRKSMQEFMTTFMSAKKYKTKSKLVFTQGPLYVRLQGQLGSYYFFTTNVPQDGFTTDGKTLFWDQYVLINSKKFSVLGKEVKL